MQKSYTLSIIAFLLLFNYKSAAQQFGVTTFIGDNSKMSSKHDIDNDMANGTWATRLSYLKSDKYTFTVNMKDGLRREVQSKIYVDKDLKKSYLLAADDANPGHFQKIYCDKTLWISRPKGDGAVIGMATDSCWMFPLTDGKITVYSFLADDAGPYSWLAFKEGRGPVQPFNFVLIGPLVKDDPKAYKQYLKKNYLKAIEIFNAD